MAKYGIVKSDQLNLRDTGSSSGNILSVLTKSTVLDIIRDAGYGWYQVRVHGTNAQGYVSGVYLTLTDTAPAAVPTPTPPPAPKVPPPAPTPVSVTPPVPPPAPVPVTPPVPPAPPVSQRAGEVTSPSLNIRSGPGTSYSILSAVTQGTVLTVLANQGDWIKIRYGVGEGYVAAQYVDLTTTKPANGFLIERSDLLSADLIPPKVIPTQKLSNVDSVVARVWNSFGGLLGRLSTQLNIPTNGLVAVLCAESGGTCFGPDGRTIIRFENHIFYQYWGKAHEDVFNCYFTFDRSSPANGRLGHQWRADTNAIWQTFHGNQVLEWQVLDFARKLDDTAALSSISMGAPQIMGFNYRRLGYDSVQRMFAQFGSSAQVQILALFDFVKGLNATSPAIQALQTQDYVTFATGYNGSGNAQTYATIIQRYSSAFDRLIQSAVPRKV